MDIKFDKLNLSIPIGDIEKINVEKVTVSENEGGIKSFKYLQKFPFEFLFHYTTGSDYFYIEFTGKCLLDFYPELIHKETIKECFFNINQLGICKINSSEAIKDATVKKCDVTVDIDSDVSIADIYNTLSFTNNQKFSFEYLDSRKKSRFAINSTHATQRSRQRLVVYDKGIEMKTSKEVNFLDSVSNRQEQIEYFNKNRIRIELNLNSCETIRKHFNMKENEEIKLTALLSSNADPIGKFLKNVIRPYDYTIALINKFGSPKEIKNLLFIALYDYDMNELERHIRSISNKKVSIKERMKTYNSVYDRILPYLNNDVTRFTLIKLSEEIKSSLHSLLSGSAIYSPNVNLINLYNNYLKTPEQIPLF